MPRSGGFGSRRTSSRSAGAGALPRAAPAANTAPARPEARPGMLSGIGSTIAQGMAFGAGSEVAHQAVRSMFGGGHAAAAPVQPAGEETQPRSNSARCQMENDNLVNCLKFHTSDISQCQDYMSLLKQCETRSS